MTINEILAVVRSDAASQVKDSIIFTILMASIFVPLAIFVYRKLKRYGLLFALISSGFLYSMATKPTPQIIFDTGLSNNGSYFNTNNWSQICFRWNKSASILGTEPVYFAAKHKDYQELEYDEIGQSTAGQLAWDYSFIGGENATNYLYYVFTIGEVHTNGVWLGNILQKVTPGTCGPDKMVIMKSRLEVDGKQIAPIKEK